jgi:predicted TPR repeat methyltransferase
MNRKERRAIAKSGSAEDLCALAAVLEQEGKKAEAADRYRQALRLNPRLGRAHNNLANVLNDLGRTSEAVAHYKQAIAAGPPMSVYHNNLGRALGLLRQLDEAAAAYRDAVALQPDFAEAHNGLGLVLVELGRFDEAIASYRRALDLNPHHLKARINLADALVRQGRTVEALGEAEIASRASRDPGFPRYLMGVVLARCGAADAARACLNAHLQSDPEDIQGVRLILASLGDGPLPERASRAQLSRFYALRANTWDAEAKPDNGYRGADLVAAMLDRFAGTEPLDILDAGCGTGLVGRLVAGRARRLTGVDVSAAMLAKAKDKSVYHQLHEADLVTFLDGHPQRFDAVTCAATLIHFGDLQPVFAGAATSLRDGGVFVFTLFPNTDDEDGIGVEALGGFAEIGCYRHGAGYVRRLAQAAGFVVEALEPAVQEYAHGAPKMALVGALRRASRSAADAAA